jgi:putative Mn2+ efflux pump MntP
MLKLFFFVLPLGLDTFAVSTALGLRGQSRQQRLRISLLFSAFEMVMPLLGLLLGRGLGAAIGSAADYLAIGLLSLVGAWMLLERDDEDEKISQLATGHGLAFFALGISISLDEFAIGFTIGLLHLTLWIAVLLIGAQAFLVAQLGLRLGARLGKSAGEAAQRLAGVALIALAALLLGEKVTG